MEGKHIRARAGRAINAGRTGEKVHAARFKIALKQLTH
jgi:hypothetical protein